MPPGPGLAAALAEIEADTLPDDAAVGLLQACARQLAHDHARFHTAMLRVQRASEAETAAEVTRLGRAPVLGADWLGDEIGAALCWTATKAGRELHVAQWLVQRLPLVHAELAAGRIDHGRAWTFVDVLGEAELTDAQLERICQTVVPLAHGLTSGQLRHRLLKLLIGVDPGYAARRYRKAVRERGVHGYVDHNGTATITGHGLGTDEAVAACERIEHLADAVKAAGHPATVRQIRADLYIRLLDGRLHGMTTEQMIAALLTDTVSDAIGSEGADVAAGAEGAEAGDPQAGALSARAAVEPALAADARTEGADAVIEEHDDPTGATGGNDPTVEPQAAPTAAATDADGQRGPENPTTDDPRPAPSLRHGGEIRVGLGTLIGLDDHPGEVPGWGPVLAQVARAMAGRQHRAEWRFAVTDPEGYLILAGVTRRRPRHADQTAREAVGGIVEIHISAAALAALAADDLHTSGPWGPVIADLAGQYAARDRYQQLLDDHPEDRFANAALRRHVQIRDRTCTAPGCRRAARRCDLDHTQAREHGGLTTAGNSGPACTRHHLMKHEGGWQLDQPRAGHFTWTSPLGRQYRTRGEPICPPPPEPAPRDPEPDQLDRSLWVGGSILQRPPPPPPTSPEPEPPPYNPADDVPPF